MRQRMISAHPAAVQEYREQTDRIAAMYGFLTDGRALYIECKTRTGRVSPEQQEFHDKAKKAGCVAIIARSVADVWEVLDGVLRGQKDSAQKELASS